MDTAYLRNAAESYDFAKGFLQPSGSEISGNEIQNFGVMLSALMQQRLAVTDIEKFDLVSYFMHFFLGMAFPYQHSKKMRADLHIEKIFWRFEGDDELKVYVSTVDGSKKKLMMKRIMFDRRNEPTEKTHYWSDGDFLDIISKIGPDIKSYDIESHHYNLKFNSETKKGDTINLEREFFITSHYDPSVKIKPSLIKKKQRTPSSSLNEIKPIEGENDISLDDHFDGMLLRPEQADQVKTSAKDFSSHVIQNFKTHFKYALPEAQCGFMHGNLFPFQKKYDFFAEASQFANTEGSLSQYDIFLHKKFTSSYKRLMPDYPLVFYVVDTHPGMGEKEIERRVVEIMIKHSAMRKMELPQQSLAEKVLITYVNFNAQKNTVSQKEVPTIDNAHYNLRKKLTALANLLRSDNHNSELEAIEVRKSIKSDLEGIFYNSLMKEKLCTMNSRCLSNYLNGMFSTDDRKVYTVKPKVETGEGEVHRKNFLLETDSRDLQVMLCLHEIHTLEQVEFGIDHEVNVPSLNKDSKFVAVVHVSVQYSEEAVSEWITPIIETDSFLKNIKWNKDFQIEQIKQFNLAEETVRLSSNTGLSKSDAKEFFQSKQIQFRNFQDFAAFAMGCFHKAIIFTNIARPSPKTMQIVYTSIINPDVEEQKMLVVANFMFGRAEEVDNALTELAKFHAETVRHKVAGKRFMISYALIDNPETGAKETEIFNERHLSILDSCSKMKRLKRSICEYDESLKRLKEQVKLIEEKQEKVPTPELGPYEKITFFKTLGKISHGVMTGLMLKSMIADLVQGNYWGVAINAGFVLANIGTKYASSRLITKAETLTEAGRTVLGATLKSGAPFLTRSASFLFIGYDLYSNLHSNDTSIENKVAIGADITYLSLDLAETSIEVAEAVGVIEGVSAAGGPILWAVGAAVMVGSDIYRAVKQVERIMAVVPLTGAERLVEGLRGFIGLGPSRVVNDKSALQANEKIVQKLLPSIMNNEQIKRYVTPLQSSQHCSWDKFIDLTSGIHKFSVSAASPKLPDGFSYFCSTTDYEECNIPIFLEIWSLLITKLFSWNLVETHMCAGVAGIVNQQNGHADHTYYELTDGHDYVRASTINPNVFEVGNGEKDVHGGDKDDIFLLIGSQTTGLLDGKDGSNLLSLAHYKFNSTINITQSWLIDLSNIRKPKKMVEISNFDQIHGRPDQNDHVTVWCSLNNMNTLGGSQVVGHDKIYVPKLPSCWYNLTMTLLPNTAVINEASHGHFHYHIQQVDNGHSQVSLDSQSVTAEHVITFEHNFFDFSSVHTLLHLHPKKLIFTMDDNSTLTIETVSLRNVKIAFKDDVQFHLHNKHLVAGLTTTQNLTMIENLYAGVISRSTVTMIIHSKLTNETLTLSGGRHHGKDSRRSVNIHHSDTNGKTHLKGNQHQNIFTISPYFDANTSCAKFHEVSISVKGDSKNLIDFTSVRRAVARLSSEITFKLVMEHADALIIYALNTNGDGTLQCDHNVGQIKLHMENSTRNIVLMNKGPLRLKFGGDNPYLESPPLHFNQSQNIIVLSDHDIEETTLIVIDKNMGDDYVFYSHNGTLLVTNVHQDDSCQMLDNVSKDSVAVLIMDYSSSKALQSIVLKFNDVTISLEKNSERKINRWIEFAAKFDLMKCIWRAILKLPVLATPIMAQVDPKKDTQQSEVLQQKENEHVSREGQQISVDHGVQEERIALSPDGLTTQAFVIDDIHGEEGMENSQLQVSFEKLFNLIHARKS